MAKYIAIAVLSGMLSAFSQILLKKSAEKRKESVWGEYLNMYVVSGYMIMLFCMILTIIAYRGIPFKYGAVLEALVYLYIMILSKVFLKEQITKRKVSGNVMIIIGVIIFSLGN